MRRPLLSLTALAAAVVVLAAACAIGGQSHTANGKVPVVAAESFWGSLARQLGGDRVDVTEIINSPDADPHDYEPTPADGRDVATSRYVILNGLGYDTWANDLVDADSSDSRTVLDVGDLLGLHTGDNPHRWYFPGDVARVIDRITADLQSIDPTNASYYAQQHDSFTNSALRPYHDLLAEIRAKDSGTPVGASQSIVAGLAEATGLDLTTPSSFLDAISEGNDPSASDKVTVDRQIADHQISVFIYNSQNATPDVQRLVSAAQANRIPAVTVTETPVPAGVTFQDWQTAQLQRLAAALAEDAGMTMTRADAIDVHDGAISFGGRSVWTDLDVHVPAGEFVAVLGPNGVGKSTLLRVVLGLQTMNHGVVRVFGRPPDEARSLISYLPQRRTFDASLRIRGVDVVRLGADGARWGLPISGRARRQARETVDEVIHQVGASGYAHRPIGEVSGGEQQRLLIAQALVRRPWMLLLDEPLDSLDLPNQAMVAKLVAELCRAEGITVVLVAHDVNPILPYVDRVVYLGQGGAATGPPEQVITTETLTQLYRTPIEVLHASDGRLVVVGQPEAPAHHHDRHAS